MSSRRYVVASTIVVLVLGADIVVRLADSDTPAGVVAPAVADPPGVPAPDGQRPVTGTPDDRPLRPADPVPRGVTRQLEVFSGASTARTTRTSPVLS
ncbi:hypothetical protein AB0F81_27475 [Actinoplanes sp. NPDC024001]|uniref:hypothetical protein n=1 Tax=Actinoplanes sp. NPDC024001 TaxID=3154598 RepID=UPI00340BEBFD